jgi:hypothetical protein
MPDDRGDPLGEALARAERLRRRPAEGLPLSGSHAYIVLLADAMLKLRQELSELDAGYQNCAELALTYHGEAERLRASLTALIGCQFGDATICPFNHAGCCDRRKAALSSSSTPADEWPF